MPFVTITRLRVRRWRYVPQFLVQSIRAARQAKRSAGSISVSVLRDADRAFWTRTVWRDEVAVRWVQDRDEPPSWAEAHRRLQGEGQRSRVSYPSEAQRRFEIREPRASAGLVLG